MKKLVLTTLFAAATAATLSAASLAACAGCHGADGKGVAGVGPDIKTYSNDLVAAVLKDGKKSTIGAMPSFTGMLTDTQVKAVATYLRSIGE